MIGKPVNKSIAEEASSLMRKQINITLTARVTHNTDSYYLHELEKTNPNACVPCLRLCEKINSKRSSWTVRESDKQVVCSLEGVH